MNLFETKLPEKRLHPSFRQIKQDPGAGPVREVIQSWAEGLLNRRGEQKKFVTEFQTTFNSAFWEIYLTRAFAELGFKVDYTKASPDFSVECPSGYQFNVEAVISDRSQEPARNPNQDQEADFKLLNTLKLAGKIKDKRDIYLGQKGNKSPYSTLDHVKGRPFVIAVAPFNSDHSLMQNNEIINRVLFGIEAPDQGSLLTGVQKKVSSVSKPSGAPVELAIFTNDSYKEISAVVFSTTGTYGKAVVASGIDRVVRSTRYRQTRETASDLADARSNLGVSHRLEDPRDYRISLRFVSQGLIAGSDVRICSSDRYQESHLDGLHIYYNPFADIPLNRAVFDAAEITHNWFDPESGQPMHQHPDGALVSRQVFEPAPGMFEYLVAQFRNLYGI
ncbi:MAG: hypothetical protein JXQ91_06130 [Vannielia sp.]|uniref:hypothetical protein n=1 Tax=Vannielia sp. TaxID=2813045 RepID=UPI003B8B9624